MVYIRPLSQGYTAYNIYGNELYSDATHQRLFDFVEADVTEITDLLNKYFCACIDIDTLTLKPTDKLSRQVKAIKKRMEELHPYLAANNYYTLYIILSGHLNSLLIYKKAQVTAEEYSKLLGGLLRPCFALGKVPLPPFMTPTSDEFCRSHYNEYLNTQQNGQALPNIKYLEKVQLLAKRYLYWVLDISTVRFGKLTVDERCRLYSRIFHTSLLGPNARLVQQLHWAQPEKTDPLELTGFNSILRSVEKSESEEGILRSVETEQAMRQHRRDERLTNASAFSALLDDDMEIDAEMQSVLDLAIMDASSGKDTAPFSEYEVLTFSQMIQLEVWLMLNETAVVKRCRNCGRYFVTERLSVDYCSNIPDGETQPCVVVGPKRSFSKLLKEDMALQTYNRTYKTYYARLRRGSVTDEAFAVWKAEARTRLDDTRSGKYSTEEFETWLKQDIRKWEGK